MEYNIYFIMTNSVTEGELHALLNKSHQNKPVKIINDYYTSK